MLVWLIFAVVTALALIPVLRPLWRAPKGGPVLSQDHGMATDVALYKAQLDEIEETRARGLLNEQDAASARQEVARRLLAREADAKTAQSVAGPLFTQRLALASAAFAPLIAVAIYYETGAPWLPAQPFSERQNIALKDRSAEDLIRLVETKLLANPEDGTGWDVIAPVYFQQQRYEDAARAYANALRLQGETTRRLAGFGESIVYSANGVVTEVARDAFAQILKREPDRAEPKFWLALAQEQDGKTAEALAAYRALLVNAPADARWRPVVEDRVRRLDPASAPPKTEPALPPPALPPIATPKAPAVPPAPITRGPSADDVKAVQALAPKDQQALIAGMVDGLAQRLAKEPKDLNGWIMLSRSYIMLGRKADAATAIETARKSFTGDQAALARLTEHAKNLGLGS